MQLVEIKNKGDLINAALQIVQELSKSPIADFDGADSNEISKIKKMIINARSITSGIDWKYLINIKK